MAMNTGGALFDERQSLAGLFHALAEPTRLALLEHLASGEHRVRDLVDHMHLAQSTVSKHLACLRDCGLVDVRVEGRASWFSLAQPEALARLSEHAGAVLAGVDTAPLRDHLGQAADPHVGEAN